MSIIRDIAWRLSFWRNTKNSPKQIINFLRESQYFDRNAMEAYQLEHTNKLLASAKSVSPFYKVHLSALKGPLSKIDDLQQLPLLTKEQIQNNYSDIEFPNLQGRSFIHSTSGSTGSPIVTKLSSKAQAFRAGGHYRFYEWWGLRPHDRNILVWAQKATVSENPGFFKKLRQNIRSFLVEPQILIDVFKLSSKSIKKYYHQAVAHKPVYIRGYLSGVLQFAELIDAAGLDGKALNLKLAIVTSEVLHQEQREFIERVLACPVANEYGAAETGQLGFQCPEGNMHLFEESVAAFTLEDKSLVVTEFHNDHAPFINYVNNDLITFSPDPCPCGRTARVIESVGGRIGDFVITDQGEKVSPYLFYYAMKELGDIGYPEAVLKYKAIQDGPNVELILIKGHQYCEEAENYVLKRILDSLGDGTSIDLRFVEDIPREKSGKLRFFVQLTPDYRP